MKTLARTLGATALAFAVMASIGSASAEDFKTGAWEGGGFIGGTAGVGGNFTIGGNAGKAIKPRLLIMGQFEYIHGSSCSAFGVSCGSHDIEFDANAHYLFPIKNDKWTPYALGGLGFLHASASSGGFSASSTHVGLNLGGGVRYAAGKDWGVRPEISFFLSNGSYTRFSVGVYKTFGQ